MNIKMEEIYLNITLSIMKFIKQNKENNLIDVVKLRGCFHFENRSLVSFHSEFERVFTF